ANGAGVAMKAMPASSPSQAPGRKRRSRSRQSTREPADTPSDVADLDDLVALHAAGRLHVGRVAGFLADHRAGDRRADRDQALLQVGLVVAHDLVGDFLAGRL